MKGVITKAATGDKARVLLRHAPGGETGHDDVAVAPASDWNGIVELHLDPAEWHRVINAMLTDDERAAISAAAVAIETLNPGDKRAKLLFDIIGGKVWRDGFEIRDSNDCVVEFVPCEKSFTQRDKVERGLERKVDLLKFHIVDTRSTR